MQRQWHGIHFSSLCTPLPSTGGLISGPISLVDIVDVTDRKNNSDNNFQICQLLFQIRATTSLPPITLPPAALPCHATVPRATTRRAAPRCADVHREAISRADVQGGDVRSDIVHESIIQPQQGRHDAKEAPSAHPSIITLSPALNLAVAAKLISSDGIAHHALPRAPFPAPSGVLSLYEPSGRHPRSRWSPLTEDQQRRVVTA